MQEHIQHTAPLLPVDLIGQKDRRQDDSHLEHTPYGAGNDLAEQQAVGGSAGDQHLDGPVALLAGHGHRYHLTVIYDQHEHDDHQHIAVPVIAARILI